MHTGQAGPGSYNIVFLLFGFPVTVRAADVEKSAFDWGVAPQIISKVIETVYYFEYIHTGVLLVLAPLWPCGEQDGKSLL